MNAPKKGKRVKLTEAEKHLSQVRFEDGYMFGVYETVQALEKYTGCSATEMLEELLNRGTISQSRFDEIAKKYGAE